MNGEGRPKYPPAPCAEVLPPPPSYSSLYLAGSTNEPLLVPPTTAMVHANAALREPPSYDETVVGQRHLPPHPPPKWESVPLGNINALPSQPQPPQPQQQYVVVTSPPTEYLPSVCCCMPLRGGTIFLAVVKMIWVAVTIIFVSFVVHEMEDSDLSEDKKKMIFMTCIPRICLESILLLATLLLMVCGIIKRRREFFTYYFIIFGITYTLSIIGTSFVAFYFNIGITYRGGLLLLFDVYFCWKLYRYYNHLGRNAPVATAP